MPSIRKKLLFKHPCVCDRDERRCLGHGRSKKVKECTRIARRREERIWRKDAAIEMKGWM